MMHTRWRPFVQQLFQRAGTQPRPRRSRLRCEELEPRCQPSTFSFSTGSPDGLIGTASRPAVGQRPEIETGDDFALSTETVLNQATFTGLVRPGAQVQDVVIEIYRVFPQDSNTSRTPQVPTRVNSPSDIAFVTRDSASGQLSFSTQDLNNAFSVQNTVVNSGIQAGSGGNGRRTGEEMQFNVTFNIPFDLPAGHYFFVPQVQLSNGNFLWLSAPKPTNPPLFAGDLQTWMRNDPSLAPDWLRIGTDIVNSGPFNASFSLSGQTLNVAISSISPTSAQAEGPSFTLTVNGSNFTSASKVLFNGTPLATTFVSDSQLQATVPASDIAHEGTANITVFDPERGLSNVEPFTIND
jgi:hypothetical protein